MQRDETVVYLKKKENKIIYSNEIWKYALNTLNKQSQLIRLYKKKKILRIKIYNELTLNDNLNNEKSI